MVIAFVDGEQQLERPETGDEMGFSLASGTVGGEVVWILGAPAANRVIAVRKADLGIQREWTGTGRFGHTIVTVDVDGDDRIDLVVGAPLDGDQGRNGLTTWARPRRDRAQCGARGYGDDQR